MYPHFKIGRDTRRGAQKNNKEAVAFNLRSGRQDRRERSANCEVIKIPLHNATWRMKNANSQTFGDYAYC